MSDPWIICPACRGNGSHVNPNIDAGGLSTEDFENDPDFAEDYFDGTYDVQCNVCRGSGKVRTSVLEELKEAADDRELAMREDGVFEPGVRDYRFGL